MPFMKISRSAILSVSALEMSFSIAVELVTLFTIASR